MPKGKNINTTAKSKNVPKQRQEVLENMAHFLAFEQSVLCPIKKIKFHDSIHSLLLVFMRTEVV